MDFNAVVFFPAGLSLLFYVLLLLFTVHALFLGYHWFSYGTSKRVSLLALATYLIGGAVLLLTLALTINLA